MLILFTEGSGGKAGVSTSMLTIAAYLSEVCRQKSVVLSMQQQWNSMEGYVIGKKKKAYREQLFSGIGLEGMRKLLKAGLEEGRNADNYTFFCNEMLDLLPGYYPNEKERLQTEYIEMIPELFAYLGEYYELVFCEASGVPERLWKQLRKQADGVVVCLNQNAEGIRHYFQTQEADEIPEYYILGCYNHNSRYNLNNLRYLFRELNHRNSAILPDCTEIQDACGDGELLEAVRRGRSPDAPANLKYFYAELKKASEGLMDCMERNGAIH